MFPDATLRLRDLGYHPVPEAAALIPSCPVVPPGTLNSYNAWASLAATLCSGPGRRVANKLHR